MLEVFKKVNERDGKPKTCKFCHAKVWWHVVESRWYDVGGATLHVENCERRRKYYHDEAINSAETRRQRSSHGD